MFLCKILLFRNYLKTTVRLMTEGKLVVACIKNAQHQLVANSWSFFFHKNIQYSVSLQNAGTAKMLPKVFFDSKHEEGEWHNA